MKKIKKDTQFILYILTIILLADIFFITILFMMGTSLQDFGMVSHGDEIRRDSERLWNAESPHFPGYGWLIYVFNAVTINTISWPFNAVIVSIIFQLLTATLVFKINRLLGFKRKKAGITTLLIMFFPIQMMFKSIQPSPNSAIVFFVALGFYFYLKKRENMMILSLVLSTIVHYITNVLGLFLFLYYILNKKIAKIWKSFLILIPFVTLTLIQYFIYDDLLHYISVHSRYVSGSIIVFPFYGLLQLLMRMTVIDLLLFLYLLPFFALAIFSIYLLYKEKNYKILIFVLPLFLFSISLHATALYYEFPRFAIYLNFPILIYPIRLMIDKWKDYRVKLIFLVFLGISILTLIYLFASFPATNIKIFYEQFLTGLI